MLFLVNTNVSCSSAIVLMMAALRGRTGKEKRWHRLRPVECDCSTNLFW